jgi:hypothetical protein
MSREEMINEMSQYLLDDKAEVGLFWYNPTDEELFEVHSIPATSLKKGEMTYPKLHKDIWAKLHFRAKDRKKNGLSYESIYLVDYTQVPRGRIFLKDDTFYILTGSWITDTIKNMIIEQFNLQNCEIIFKIDSHWEIGHGWSTEQDVLNLK